MKCSQCDFAELNITSELLDTGEYRCSKGCDVDNETCGEFAPDNINKDFEYSYAS